MNRWDMEDRRFEAVQQMVLGGMIAALCGGCTLYYPPAEIGPLGYLGVLPIGGGLIIFGRGLWTLLQTGGEER